MKNDTNKQVSSPACPIGHQHLSEQFTAPLVEPIDFPIEQDSFGVWHVRGYEQAQAVLRSDCVRQAGFQAEMLEKLPNYMNPPILFLEGKQHQKQRLNFSHHELQIVNIGN